MPMAAARGAGITYRKTEQAEPHGGGGQGVIAFAAVLVAGLLFVGGAAAIFLGAPPETPAPTRAAVVDPTLPPFVQQTATPLQETITPLATASPQTSPGTSPDQSPGTSPESPGFGSSPTVSDPSSTGQTDPPTATPTRRPTSTPTRRPTPTSTNRPTPTPTNPPPTSTPTQPPEANCDNAAGEIRDFVIGFGNSESRGPIDRDWCIVGATFRWFESFGVTRLYDDQNVVATSRCEPPGPCESSDEVVVSPPHRVAAGSTLFYFFRCIDNPGTTIDECSDATPDGTTIQVFYRVLDGS